MQEAQALNLSAAVATGDTSTPSGTDAACYRAARLALARVQPRVQPGHLPPIHPGANLIVITEQAGQSLLEQAIAARASASRVSIVALPEGFYLEPGEKPRPQWVRAPQRIRELEAQAGVLAELGVLVVVLRGNQSILRLGAEDGIGAEGLT